MKRQIRKALVIVNLIKEETEELAAQVRAELERRGIEVSVAPVQEGTFPQVDPATDLAITLGGDGTLLYAARILAAVGVGGGEPGRQGGPPAAPARPEAEAAPQGIPILAVNLGDFGFITEVSRQEWARALEKYLAGKLGVSRRIMFDAVVERGGRAIASFSGLNDAVVRSTEFSRIVGLRIHLSSTYVARYRADGVILATPTGSTAYSMSAGGPILHPEMEAFILNPICPFTLANRPMVVPDREELAVEVEEKQRTGIVLLVDGQQMYRLAPGDRVVFRKSGRSTLIILSDQRNFYEVLASKLNWAGEPNA
jgi:NAD+ kinase